MPFRITPQSVAHRHLKHQRRCPIGGRVHNSGVGRGVTGLDGLGRAATALCRSRLVLGLPIVRDSRG